MELNRTMDVDEVRTVVIETLRLDGRGDELQASTPLLDSLPELDSMGVLALVLALEERFDITMQDDEITGEVFETLASLTTFVESRRC